ncbi:hypothetical protein I5Q34_29670 [Streptomyces sp. AV19]|uniref:hypothetical protein n=1 Tax=Streptomyces sp. AV19 TaxID=2793068 RepID=UPI0018FEC503|nr:hypothetical protein [Streptomyces sp. AV19]MBH1938378.1 hypothetical protein [Streptomyces sp. AV19]MDG4535027.1 hypothetical protein [Streptomyces sp. AV19]
MRTEDSRSHATEPCRLGQHGTCIGATPIRRVGTTRTDALPCTCPCHRTTDKAGRWLVSRETHPRVAREAWSKGLPATLRAGIHFDAVHVPAALVEDGIRGSRDRDAVERHFRAVGITTAVLVSRRRDRYSILVPPDTADTWNVPGAQCLGATNHTNYLATPPPTRHEPPGAHWLLPAPEGDQDLCVPDCIRALLACTRLVGLDGRTGDHRHHASLAGDGPSPL